MKKIPEEKKLKPRVIGGLTVFMIIASILIVLGYYIIVSGPYYYTNYSYAQRVIPVGMLFYLMAVSAGIGLTYIFKIISKIYITIFSIILICGFSIYSLGNYLYVSGMGIWWEGGAIPPLPDNVISAINLVLTGVIIAILHMVSLTATVIYASFKK